MKYVVSGYIGFDNFGDEAIAHVLAEKLKNEGAEKITFISSNPEKTSRIHGVDACGMLKFLKSIANADVLISGGGSLLQDVTSLKSLIYYLIVIFAALLLGKKVEIFAQGIGPINSSLGQFLTKLALKKCSKISVRDKQSQDLLSNWGIKSDLVNDPILEINLPHKNISGIVGIQLRNFKSLNETFLQNLAEEICKNFSNKKIIILSLHDDIDKVLCEHFASILNNRGLNTEVLSGLDLKEVFETISNLEYLIAMRFHAVVVGIKAGVKTLAINYDPKVEKLAKEYNLPMINFNQNDLNNEFQKLLN